MQTRFSLKLATSDETIKEGIEISLSQLIAMRYHTIIPWLSTNSRVKTNRVGGFQSRFKGRGMDFDEVRIYQNGDDIKNIDWKVTARTGNAHTKLFKEERERPVFVVLDQMPSMFFGTTQAFKSVVAANISSQLMWNALSNGDRFGALLFNQNKHVEMKPSNNRKNCMRLLNNIVENHQSILNTCFEDKAASESIQGKGKNQLAATLRRLQHLAKPGSLIHIISDFNQFDSNCQRNLSKLSQHADLHCIQVYDKIEKMLPPSGNYGITDGTVENLLNTQKTSIRQNYQQQFINKTSQIKDFVLSHRGVFTQIDTNYQHQSIGQQLSAVNKNFDDEMIL